MTTFAAEVQAAGGACLRFAFEAFGRKTQAAPALAQGLAKLGAALDAGAGLAAQAVAARLTGAPPAPWGEALLATMGPERFEALSREVLLTLARQVRVRPLLVLVEDVHWADLGELAALAGLAAPLVEAGVILVATERLAEARLGPLLRRAVAPARLELGPLSAGEGAELAQSMGVMDAASVTQALDRAGGNPLFFVRLLEAGARPAGDLPPSVVALVQEQVDRLAEAHRHTLRQAAILGQSFRPETFARVFGAADFAALIAAGFLVPELDRVGFAHALVHEAIYASATRAERRRLHAAAADVFRGEDPVRWADHALAGGAADAAEACTAAADVLLPRHAFEAGARYIASGLSVAADDAARAPLLVCRGSMRREQGALDAALADYVAAATAAGSAEWRAQALVRQAWVHRLRADLAAADAVLAEAAALPEAEVSPDIRSEIANQLGAQAFARGDHAACLAHNRRALELCHRRPATEPGLRGHRRRRIMRRAACARRGTHSPNASRSPAATATAWSSSATRSWTPTATISPTPGRSRSPRRRSRWSGRARQATPGPS